MIELNLLEKKQPMRLPNVLGLDLNALNFKMLILALILFYVPEYFVREHFENQIKQQDEILNANKTQIDKITREIGKNSNIKGQLDAFNAQVEKLKTRSAQVDEILKIKTNPKKILEKIARSIPEDLWFNQLKINENKEIFISGASYSPRSIGEFITIINDSPYFGSSLTPVKQESKQESLDGVTTSYELFELKGKIKNYDMRSR